MIITPEHKALQLQYQELVLRQSQHDLVVAKKDEAFKLLQSLYTTLNNHVTTLMAAFHQLKQGMEQLECTIKQKEKELNRLSLVEFQFEQLKKMVYGQQSERSQVVLPGQLQLDLPAEVVEACQLTAVKHFKGYTTTKGKNEGHPGRNQLPDHLEKVIEALQPANLPEDAVQIGVEETMQLEYDPGRLFATVYRRPKYKVENEDGSIRFFIAPVPTGKDKSIAAASLKAHITTEKYLYHMPIYRQQQRFSREGVVLSESTMGGWTNDTCQSLTALYEELRKGVVYASSGLMLADESTLRVLDTDKPKGKKSHLGYIWGYCNPVDRLVLFEYQKGRGSKHARPVLENFRGTLLTDGYKVYEHYAKKDGVTHACCNAHARRKHTDSLQTDKVRAAHAIALYAKLYAIEKYARENDYSFEQRKQIRQEKSVPIFEELTIWSKEQLPQIPNLRSPIGKALSYFIQREKQLSQYLHDGMVEIDTNMIENQFRSLALGRKNFLFVGSHDAAQNAAIIYSLFATCKLHDVNPYDWLKYVLEVMPTFPVSRISELLPQSWKVTL